MSNTSEPIPFPSVGNYGPNWSEGVLADHVGCYPTRVTAPGFQIVVDPQGRPSFVRCGWIVMIPTEDGPIDGRCGARVMGDDYACPGHQAERDQWRAMDEGEKLAWEIEQDRNER